MRMHTRFYVLALTLALSAGSLSLAMQSCASSSPRHVLTGAVTGVLDGLTGVEKTADAAVTAGLVTAAQRQSLAQKLGPALVAAKSVNDAGLAWVPGAPMPQNLTTLISTLNSLVSAIGSNITDSKTLATIEGYVSAAQAALLAVLSNLPATSPAPVTSGS